MLPPVTWVCPVRSRRVVKNENRSEIWTNGRQVLGVRPEVEGAVLAVVAPPQHAALVVQLVGHGRPVDLHRRREHNQLVPLGNLK